MEDSSEDDTTARLQPVARASSEMSRAASIESGDYYSTFHGHRPRYLQRCLQALRQVHGADAPASVIQLAIDKVSDSPLLPIGGTAFF